MVDLSCVDTNVCCNLLKKRRTNCFILSDYAIISSFKIRNNTTGSLLSGGSVRLTLCCFFLQISSYNSLDRTELFLAKKNERDGNNSIQKTFRSLIVLYSSLPLQIDISTTGSPLYPVTSFFHIHMSLSLTASQLPSLVSFVHRFNDPVLAHP